MSIERDWDSIPFPFGGSGHPHTKKTPWSPETARSEIALREAERLQMEAEMNTPEGRKKARAEKIEKKNNWGSRVVIDRGNGWKPIWGSAKDEELRIYTLVGSGTGGHRFWGIKPIGMDIFEFWDKYDPEVKRYDDMQQETPVNPDAPVGLLIGEPPKNLTTKDATAKPVKRPRGRPPVERKRTGRLPKQKKVLAVKGNADVQKSPKADRPRPLAPSIHKMRTRGKGPAELLRLP